MTTLLVDAGNTRIKWRVHGGAMQVADRLEECFESWAPYDLRTLAVAATGKEDLVQALLAHMHRAFPESVSHVATSEKRFGSLVNGYCDPGTMGVDRWLTLIAASKLYPGNCLIIDAGSALTVDCLNKDGHHLGGWVIPGLTMMQQALLTKTARVRYAAVDGGGTFGVSTGAGVALGTRNALAGACERAVRTALALTVLDQILLTGGDSEVVREVLEDSSFPPLIVRSELVLDGLALWLEGHL